MQDRAGRENPALREVTRGAVKRADVGIGPYGGYKGYGARPGWRGEGTPPYKRNTDWETIVRTGFAMTHRKKCDTSPAGEQRRPPLRTFFDRMSWGAASPTPRFTERLAALRRGDPCGRPPIAPLVALP